MSEVDEKLRVGCDWVIWNRQSVLYDSRGIAVGYGELALLDTDILELMTRGEHYLPQPEQESGEYAGLGQVICIVEAKRQRGRPRKEPGPAPPPPDAKPKRTKRAKK